MAGVSGRRGSGQVIVSSDSPPVQDAPPTAPPVTTRSAPPIEAAVRADERRKVLAEVEALATGMADMSGENEAMTLAEFLLARIAEDWNEARASGVNAFAGGGWWREHMDKPAYDFVQRTLIEASKRVLAECEAKRRIVALHSDERDHGDGRITHTGVCDTCGDYYGPMLDSASEYPCPTLRLLALPYADHAEFRAEWAP